MSRDLWAKADSPAKLLHLFHRPIDDRKGRLLACSYCRDIWAFLCPQAQKLVEEAESFSDRHIQKRARLHGFWKTGQNLLRATSDRRDWAGLRAATHCCYAKIYRLSITFISRYARIAAQDSAVLSRQALLTRDILLYRHQTIDPAWRVWNDGTVVKLAQAIYDERELPNGYLDAGRLAILADALEDAGCHNTDILGHCRQPGEHVRGCWVVDSLLGKG